MILGKRTKCLINVLIIHIGAKTIQLQKMRAVSHAPAHFCGAIIGTHTGKYFPNLIKSTRNQIVLIIFQLIWIRTDVRLDPNQSENGKYNLISG